MITLKATPYIPCFFLCVIAFLSLKSCRITSKCVTGDVRVDLNNCNVYEVCISSSTWIKQHCPASLFYNIEKGVCDFANNVKNCVNRRNAQTSINEEETSLTLAILETLDKTLSPKLNSSYIEEAKNLTQTNLKPIKEGMGILYQFKEEIFAPLDKRNNMQNLSVEGKTTEVINELIYNISHATNISYVKNMESNQLKLKASSNNQSNLLNYNIQTDISNIVNSFHQVSNITSEALDRWVLSLEDLLIKYNDSIYINSKQKYHKTKNLRSVSSEESGYCGYGHWLCASGVQCILQEDRCDGKVQCHDGSDERNCVDSINFGVDVCKTEECKLPECYCATSQIPNNFSAFEIPQIVMITFDDALRAMDVDNIYKKIFTEDRRNPNGCPIKGTFFVSHEYSNYIEIHELYTRGHEIASHSITHRTPENWWKDAKFEDWIREIVGQRTILSKLALIDSNHISGSRAPFLRIGGENMLKMLKEYNFKWDASIPIKDTKTPFFPFTFEYQQNFTCTIPECPRGSYKGIWEVPINFIRGIDGRECFLVDGCGYMKSADEVYYNMMLNFHRHYKTNRAPLLLSFHTVFFQRPFVVEGFNAFLDDILKLGDVYVLPVSSTIAWMQNPVNISSSKSFFPFNTCEEVAPFSPFSEQNDENVMPKNATHICSEGFQCIYKVRKTYFTEEMFLNMCIPCPKNYPDINTAFDL